MSSDAALPATLAVPILPEEIIDIIIHHCHADKTALSALALVSWSWLHSARRRLFARVELSELYDYRSSGETAGELGSSEPFWKFQFGLELIARSPAIASYIRFLQIRANSNREVLVAQGFQFLSRLPNLRTLSLVGIYWPCLKPENVPIIMGGISTVASTLEELSLTTVTFVNTDDLALFVRAFPKVKRVSFSFCEWENKWLGPEVLTTTPVFRGLPEPSLICLEYVGIHNCPPQAILEILLQRAAFKLDCLKGVKIYWDAERLTEFPLYEKLFRIVGRNLQSIELRVRVKDFHQPTAIMQLLSECRQLSSFTINTCYRRRYMLLAWFEPILQTVATATLEEFTIHCNLYSTRERNLYIPWGRLDATLSRVSRFRQLDVVVHRVDLEDIDLARREAVYSNLREMMPRLVQADMLRIREPEVDAILAD